jgi:hypothetical protein
MNEKFDCKHPKLLKGFKHLVIVRLIHLYRIRITAVLKVETDIITSIIVSPIGQVLSDNFQYHLMLTITLGEIKVKMSKLPLT